jgi:hypothetical protein
MTALDMAATLPARPLSSCGSTKTEGWSWFWSIVAALGFVVHDAVRENPYEPRRGAPSLTRGPGRRHSFEGHDALSGLPTFIACCGVRLLSSCSA